MNSVQAALATALATAATTAHAQVSNIDDSNKHAWGENIGFTNWRDANGGSAGVHVYPTHLIGAIWAENVGWIRVGAGPADGAAYANADSSDYGVNVEPGTGALSGYAWGENIGWVNFGGGGEASPSQPALYLDYKGRFYGYVWSENAGWINLESNDAFVGVYCFSDFDANGFVNGEDFDAFTERFEAGDQAADIDGNGFVNGEDFDAFAAAFAAGC